MHDKINLRSPAIPSTAALHIPRDPPPPKCLSQKMTPPLPTNEHTTLSNDLRSARPPGYRRRAWYTAKARRSILQPVPAFPQRWNGLAGSESRSAPPQVILFDARLWDVTRCPHLDAPDPQPAQRPHHITILLTTSTYPHRTRRHRGSPRPPDPLPPTQSSSLSPLSPPTPPEPSTNHQYPPPPATSHHPTPNPHHPTFPRNSTSLTTNPPQTSQWTNHSIYTICTVCRKGVIHAVSDRRISAG